MICVHVNFDGNPARLELRPQHRQRLADLHAEGSLLMAGPYADESGALVVFRIDDEQRVRELLAEDPYYSAPGVQVVQIRAWKPVVGPDEEQSAR